MTFISLKEKQSLRVQRTGPLWGCLNHFILVNAQWEKPPEDPKLSAIKLSDILNNSSIWYEIPPYLHLILWNYLSNIQFPKCYVTRLNEEVKRINCGSIYVCSFQERYIANERGTDCLRIQSSEWLWVRYWTENLVQGDADSFGRKCRSRVHEVFTRSKSS